MSIVGRPLDVRGIEPIPTVDDGQKLLTRREVWVSTISYNWNPILLRFNPLGSTSTTLSQ